MKSNRTICRFLLPLLFVVLLSVGVILLVSARDPSGDDIAEDILRFDLLSDGKKATQVCAWSGNRTDYYLFLPSFAGPDAAVFTPLHGSKIILDDKPLQKGDPLSSLETDRTYSLTVPGNARKDLTLTMMRSSDIPALFVTISGRAMEKVLADKNNKEKASLVLFTEYGNVEYEGNGLEEIKGRGNSSWTLDKKPYHLNLSASTPLLGMDSSRHWVLLSNGYDRTSLRNKLVYDFAGRIALPWTPECRYVDLFVNGEYNGLYLLSEQVEFDAGRINPSNLESSFLAEINEQGKENINHHFFLTKGGRCFKIVEPDKYKTKRFSSIYHTLQRMEDAILSLTEDSPWPDFLDLDSFVRRYLIDEIFLNPDGDLSSSFYYWDASVQKMFAFPIWDYDMSCGNSPHENKTHTVFPEQLYAKYTLYYRKLYANRVFFSRMTELYRTEFLPLLEMLIEKDLPDLESLTAHSSLMNTVRWAEMYQKMRDGKESDAEKLAELYRFLQNRDAFLKTAWIDMKEYISVRISGNEGGLIAIFITETGARARSIPSPEFYGLTDSDQWYAGGTDVPLDPNTCLTDGMHLFPSPHSVRVNIVKQIDALDEPNGPVDYVVRLIRHDGGIVIPLFCLLLLLFAMSLYALLNDRKTGGRRK
ncbi:MAG: CotH kinase family protein [Clostridia bacterium]|nr:CotH kinase family protein [Clostridia bacterium]